MHLCSVANCCVGQGQLTKTRYRQGRKQAR